jgi:hypothetical protein
MWGTWWERWGWHLAWAAVFAANLVVPVMLGWEVTRRGGRGGLVGAVVLLWVAGHLLVARVPAIGQAVVLGGLVTAATQVYPMLQGMAGVTSLWMVEWLSNPAAGREMFLDGMNDATAFAATLLTAAQVGVVALVCGPVVRAAAELAGDVFGLSRFRLRPRDAAQDPVGPPPSPSTASTTQQPLT